MLWPDGGHIGDWQSDFGLVEECRLSRQHKCGRRSKRGRNAMLTSKEVLFLSKLSTPVLTAYLDAGAPAPANSRFRPSLVTWVRQKAKSLIGSLPAKDREAFRNEVARVEEFLRDQNVKESVVIFSNPSTWKLVPLHRSIRNDLNWGTPAIWDLMEAASECKPCCVVAVDRSGAKFFRYELGQMTDAGQIQFKPDFSQWKKTEYSHMARQSTKMPHGPQRDAFKKRMDAQYQHFCKRVAENVKKLAKGAAVVLLVGSKRLTNSIEASLPAELRKNTAICGEDLTGIPLTQWEGRIASRIAEWIDEQAVSRVEKLSESKSTAITGLDETLARIQAGTVGKVILTQGFDALVRQCSRCGLSNRAADRICSICGGERRSLMLSDILPGLLRANEVEIEFAHGEAARKLIGLGGIGGWLRQREKVMRR